MRCMLHMLQRMANRAQNLKVFQCVIASIAVFMVYTQYFWLCIIPAPFALNQHFSRLHRFANRVKCWRPNFFAGLVNAGFRAKLSFARRRVPKRFVAVLTNVFYRAFTRHAFVVARPTTVFSFVCSASYVRKSFTALFAVSLVLYARCARLARSAAKKCRVFSVVGYGKNCATVRATFLNSFARSHHASC